MAFALGAHVGQQNMTADEMRALWRKLDAGGLDWISAWDHIYEAPPAGGTIPHFEAVATLGAMAVETSRARLGSLVFYVGYRNPALLAKMAATLDHLSGGRFELGLGAGWHVQEAEAYGYDFPSLGTRLDMLEEAVQLVRGLLTQDRTTFEGEHFTVRDASNLPMPVQERLPVWIGGVGEKRTLPMAARHADGWNAAYVAPDQYAHLCGVLDAACEASGRDPASIERTINVTFNIGMTEAAAAAATEALHAQWGPMAERIAGGSLLGTPDQAVEKILAYRDAGADGLNVALRAPWDPETLDAYLEHIVPAVRSA